MPAKKTAKKPLKTATKKAAVIKKTVAKKPPVKRSFIANKEFVRTHKKQLIIGTSVLVVVALLYFFRSLFVVALVNGIPLTRVEFQKEIEKQSGKKVLDDMITKALIFQEAQRKNISISQSEIDAEIKKIEESLKTQGQTLDSVLAMQGFSKSDLVERIRLQKIVGKLVSSSISISDSDVNSYIEQNRTTFPEGTSEEDMKNQAKEQLTQQKTDEKIQAFVADLQKKAKITYFINL